jgi:hypothetical protein
LTKKKREAVLPDMVPNRTRRWEEDSQGRVRVFLPRYGDSSLGRWLADRVGRPDVAVNLDEFGSAVWNGCDGRNTVARIAELLRDRFGERVEPVDERLGMYLWGLFQRRMITWDSEDLGTFS